MATITEQTIRQRSNSKSFERGKQYYRQGAISDTAKRGNTLEARCEGSQYKPYRVKVTLDKNGAIEATFCDCEYDYGDDCKHIIALLLTYVHQPEAFEAKPPLEDSLKDRTPEQLIALINQMVNRYPDLESLVHRPVAGRTTRQKAVNVETFRRELRQAMRHFSHEWGDTSISDTIVSVTRAGKEFADNGDWHSASAIFRVIYDEYLDDDEFYDDEEGNVSEALDAIVAELAECLTLGKLAEDDTERRVILHSLLQVYIWNIDIGGQDVGVNAPDVIVQHARKADLPALREKIIAAKKTKEGQRYSEWAVENYEAFLMDLDALDETDPEIILKRLRDNGQYYLLTEKLLTLGRIDEALNTIRKELNDSFNLLRLMPSLMVHAGEDTALSLAKAALSKNYHPHLNSWLIHYAETAQKLELVLELRLNDFYNPPHYIAKYEPLKKAAQLLDKWDSVYQEVIAHLQKNKLYALLTQVYLQEKQAENAWNALALHQKMPANNRNDWYGFSNHSLEFEVAQQTRHDNPEKSLPFYRQHIRNRIDQRNRSAYAEAAGYLQVVEELYDAMGEYEKWEDYITGIKTEFKKLPALMDELRKAKL